MILLYSFGGNTMPLKNKLSSHELILNMVYISLFVVLITICSWISIPMQVPFTLQTLSVFATIGMLGGKKATIVILIYILLGMVGLPVFSNFQGGFGVIFGSTGGYIIGFLCITLLCWLIQMWIQNKLVAMIVGMGIGMILMYAFGTIWFMHVYMQNTGKITLWTALGWCVFPFIIPDLIKMVIAIIVSLRLSKYVKIKTK